VVWRDKPAWQVSDVITDDAPAASEAPKDGLTQPQREAIVELLTYCMYADNLVMLSEDRLISDRVAKSNWDPKAVLFRSVRCEINW
jgi:hypothetical protein